jgi:hypothetical protein
MERMTQTRQILKKKKIQIARFLWVVPVSSQEHSGFCSTFILVCSQIWLNHLMNDSHFSDITKLKKKTQIPSVVIYLFELFFRN